MDERHVLLVEIHRAIEGIATNFAEALTSNRRFGLIYPPNGGLSELEYQAIAKLPKDATTKSAIRKVIADAASGPIFQLFALIDAEEDPHHYDGSWSGFRLEAITSAQNDKPTPSWNEDFVQTFQDWSASRPDPGWKLDG